MMGFNPIFYAGYTKLSQVVIDTDLDMGGNGIKSNSISADSILADSAVLGGVRVENGRVEHVLRTYKFKFEASDDALTDPVSSDTRATTVDVWFKGAIIHLPETFEPSTYNVVAKVAATGTNTGGRRFRVQTPDGEVLATTTGFYDNSEQSLPITTSGGIYEVWFKNSHYVDPPVSLVDLVVKGTLRAYPVEDVAPHDITVEAV
jgi:hypothetical protein